MHMDDIVVGGMIVNVQIGRCPTGSSTVGIHALLRKITPRSAESEHGKFHSERKWVWKIPQRANSEAWVVNHLANLPRFRGILRQGSPSAGMKRGEMSRFLLAHRPSSQIPALISICTFSGINVAKCSQMKEKSPGRFSTAAAAKVYDVAIVHRRF